MYNLLEFNPSNKHLEEISLGNNYPENFAIYKFGRNDDIGASESLISEGGVYGMPILAQTVTITSTSGDDVIGGDGARAIKVYGLDENFNMIEEIIAMGSVSVNEYIRVFRAHVVECGNYQPISGANLGTVSIIQSVSGVEMVKIGTNDGQTLCACYTIPNGYTGLVWQAETNIGEGKSCIARLKTRDNAVSNSTFLTKGIRDNYQNVVGNNYKFANKINEKTDVIFTAKSSASGVSISGSFIIQLIKN